MKQILVRPVNVVEKTTFLPYFPERSSAEAAGYDLHSTERYTLKSGERHLFGLAYSIEIPTGYYGRIAPRSGLALKKGIDVMAGVIDSDYRGEVGVILINLGSDDHDVFPGDKIAQLIIEQHFNFECVLSTTVGTETMRGSGGFGSTGN